MVLEEKREELVLAMEEMVEEEKRRRREEGRKEAEAVYISLEQQLRVLYDSFPSDLWVAIRHLISSSSSSLTSSLLLLSSLLSFTAAEEEEEEGERRRRVEEVVRKVAEDVAVRAPKKKVMEVFSSSFSRDESGFSRRWREGDDVEREARKGRRKADNFGNFE